MAEAFDETLRCLRRAFYDRAEQAYAEEAVAEHTSRRAAYAAGMAYAYGDAEGLVRLAEAVEVLISDSPR